MLEISLLQIYDENRKNGAILVKSTVQWMQNRTFWQNNGKGIKWCKLCLGGASLNPSSQRKSLRQSRIRRVGGYYFKKYEHWKSCCYGFLDLLNRLRAGYYAYVARSFHSNFVTGNKCARFAFMIVSVFSRLIFLFGQHLMNWCSRESGVAPKRKLKKEKRKQITLIF